MSLVAVMDKAKSTSVSPQNIALSGAPQSQSFFEACVPAVEASVVQGRGGGRAPGTAEASWGRNSRGTCSNQSRSRGRGRASNDAQCSSAAVPVRGGRGRGHPIGHGNSGRLPSHPAALQVQAGWEGQPLENLCGNAHFGNQQEVIDFLLGEQCRNYNDNIQQNLSLKFSLHSMECNKVNLFHLLISSAFDSLLEYTNESLNDKNLIPLSYGEIGMLLLSTIFNTSTEQAWSLMGLLTSNKHMVRERFIQLLTNLRGYDVRPRIISSSTSWWLDQQNTLDHLHILEKKVYKRSIKFFFDSTFSCLFLDDEMIGSKANDDEMKLVSDQNGPHVTAFATLFSNLFWA